MLQVEHVVGAGLGGFVPTRLTSRLQGAGDQPQDVAAVGARFFLGLAVLLPAVLLFYNYANQESGQQPQLYRQRNDRLVIML